MGDYKTIALVLILIIIGFKGTRSAVVCSTEVPCLNEGTCLDNVCTCTSGYTGATCSETTVVCSTEVPCLNEGTCLDNVCTCTSGYTGATCSETIVVCSTEVACLNDGTCLDNVCTCTSGYTGATCSDIVVCSTEVPCLNDGTCVNNVCTCTSGYTGATCSDIDCSGDNPCQNGGTCENNACTCATGFDGALCSTELNSLSAAIKVSGVEYTAALGDTSTTEFMEAADLWEERITDGYCNATADSRNGTACQIMVNPTGFSDGSLVVHFTAVFDSSVSSTLNASNIQILNENGIPYVTTVSGVTLICGGVTCVDCTSCSEATTPTTRSPGRLQCHSCSTNSITDVCSTADDLASGSGVSTVTCYEGQRCWTDHYENSSHTIVSRGCTDEECSDLHEGGGPYCTMANDATRCTSCCIASKCNDNKSSSEGLTSNCVTWLTSFFSVVVVLITYRT